MGYLTEAQVQLFNLALPRAFCQEFQTGLMLDPVKTAYFNQPAISAQPYWTTDGSYFPLG